VTWSVFSIASLVMGILAVVVIVVRARSKAFQLEHQGKILVGTLAASGTPAGAAIVAAPFYPQALEYLSDNPIYFIVCGVIVTLVAIGEFLKALKF
jgi:cation transport ATPase